MHERAVAGDGGAGDLTGACDRTIDQAAKFGLVRHASARPVVAALQPVAKDIGRCNRFLDVPRRTFLVEAGGSDTQRFHGRGDLGDAIAGLLPDYILVRRDDTKLAGARTLFDLIRAEAAHTGDAPSPLINRLTDALFLYALRAVASADEFAPGLWSVMRRAEFSPLVSAIIENPGADWTTHAMAAFCRMSRARFCRQFTEACGQPPAQFLALVRMKVAAEMLRHGASMPGVAEHVGYQSESAFAQAFKRVTGLPPGTCRRQRGGSGVETRMH